MSVRLLGALLAALAFIAARPGDAALLLSRSFDSAALGRPLAYSVYLPPGYDREPARRYPVVYLLHGVGGNERAWPGQGKVEATADRLIGSGAIPPVVIVMPDVGSSWLVDSAALGGPGDYDTAVRRDLTAHVEASYRALAGRPGRAIAGLSMGGFGALRLAFEAPEEYCAAAAMSPMLWWNLRPGASLTPGQAKMLDGAFGTPFDRDRLERQAPQALIPDAGVGARPAVYLTAGDDDELRNYDDAFNLFLLLRASGMRAELRITDGGHSWSSWTAALPGVLRFLAGELEGGCAGAG